MGPPKEIRESEKVVDEKVTRRTEEYLDEVTGERRVRTVEYVEKLIERQVLLHLEFAPTLLPTVYVCQNEEEKHCYNDLPLSECTAFLDLFNFF